MQKSVSAWAHDGGQQMRLTLSQKMSNQSEPACPIGVWGLQFFDAVEVVFLGSTRVL